MMTQTIKLLTVAALSAVAFLSCSGELTDNASPVELVVTNDQAISIIDLGPNTGDSCNQNLGTVKLNVIPKNGSAGGNLLQVRVNRYRVSYRRTDGGTLVPATYVRAVDTLVGPGDPTGATFRIFELGAFLQAPFVALLPQNGGRDPETLRPFVRLEVILEVFGETLGGDNVYDSTRIPLEFCFDCGGCR